MNLFNIFGLFDSSRENDRLGTLFGDIEKLLPSGDNDTLKRITGYAGLLGRVAYADMEISPAEQTKMRALLQERMSLSSEQADLIVTLLVKNKVELLTLEEHFYARLINEVALKEEKINLLHALYELAAVDDISTAEDTAIYRIANNMNLPSTDVSDVKKLYHDRLSILK